jgi:hypothetical protein
MANFASTSTPWLAVGELGETYIKVKSKWVYLPSNIEPYETYVKTYTMAKYYISAEVILVTTALDRSMLLIGSISLDLQYRDVNDTNL